MKIVVVDITGRNATQYNPSLCNSIAKVHEDDTVVLLSPTLYVPAERFKWVRLLSLVPSSLQSSLNKWKKLLRAIETALNYIYVSFYSLFSRPDVIHFQWLPFLEFSGVERFFLGFLRLMSPKTALFLTVHNLYPHNMDSGERERYKERFLRINKHFSGYFAHLQSAKERLQTEFGIEEKRVFVSYHGIYSGESKMRTERSQDKSSTRIIMYGYQTRYKGADVLVDALNKLDEQHKIQLECYVVGKTDPELYKECIDDANRNGVVWINRFVSDEELYDYISSSDLILLPYRNITQSGVLLLALSYRKPILTSDLPSFLETLEGYPREYFFEANSSDSLAAMLTRYLDGEINQNIISEAIDRLNIKYSWDETAKSTVAAYASVLNR